ncbi:hypothetical protein [Asticcacaulis solisilvae]|uniref:hypothetical protein n=1 Tax=Asticcacaulis solisilvae TaxID=1217274 RepID=UPI003FD7C61D
MRKVVALCAIVAAGVCLAETSNATPKLFCVNDKGENVPFKYHPYTSDLRDAYLKKFGFDVLPLPSDEPDTLIFVFSAGYPNCTKLPNTMCENIMYKVRSGDGGNEFYLLEMVTNLKGMKEEKLKGDAMCWQTWTIINGIK